MKKKNKLSRSKYTLLQSIQFKNNLKNLIEATRDKIDEAPWNYVDEKILILTTAHIPSKFEER